MSDSFWFLLYEGWFFDYYGFVRRGMLTAIAMGWTERKTWSQVQQEIEVRIEERPFQ
jgi:hypothetical protein